MTVNTGASRQVLLGDGTNTVFPFSFAFPASTNPGAFILVWYTDPSGVNNFLDPAKDYTLVPNAPLGANPTPVGGTVIYSPPSGPIPLGSSLTIQRNVPLIQETSLANQGTLYQSVLEQALDYGMMAIQQVSEGSMAISGPIKGVIDGSQARPGEVGEFLVGSTTFTIAVNSGTQTIQQQPLVIPPGDWDVMASFGSAVGFDVLVFQLSPQPAGLSTNLSGYFGLYSPPAGMVFDSTVVSPRAQALVSVPTPLSFRIDITNAPVAGQGIMYVSARRMR